MRTPALARTSALAVVLTVGLALLSWPSSVPASASCAGPEILVGGGLRPELPVGGGLKVEGRYFTDGCDDYQQQDVGGCSSPPPITMRPFEDVTLQVRQGDRVVDLATTDAGTAAEQQLGEVTWEVVLPADLQPGRAVLVTDQGGRLEVRVRR